MKDKNKTIEEIKASIGHVPEHLISDYNRIDYNADSITVMEDYEIGRASCRERV